MAVNGTALGGNTRTMGKVRMFRIGSNNDGILNYDGKIDDFRVYDYELGASDIAAIYSSF